MIDPKLFLCVVWVVLATAIVVFILDLICLGEDGRRFERRSTRKMRSKCAHFPENQKRGRIDI